MRRDIILIGWLRRPTIREVAESLVGGRRTLKRDTFSIIWKTSGVIISCGFVSRQLLVYVYPPDWLNLSSLSAFSDVLQGLYLLTIAAMDAKSRGAYFNYATWWQEEGGCDIIGFISVFASELSVYTLSVITLERWWVLPHCKYHLSDVSVTGFTEFLT